MDTDPKNTDNDLRNGRVVIINGKLYIKCSVCNCIVRLDKPIFGGLHICE